MGSSAPVTGRPMRADARRNYERILTVAADAFAEHGAEASLDDIAKRAGVGPGTLYRHFPNRQVLLEHVYLGQLQELADRARQLSTTESPREALAQWMNALVDHMAKKKALITLIKAAMEDENSVLYRCHNLMHDAANTVLQPAREAGLVRDDLTSGEFLRLVHAIASIGESSSDGSRVTHERMLSLLLDGVRPPATP